MIQKKKRISTGLALGPSGQKKKEKKAKHKGIIKGKRLGEIIPHFGIENGRGRCNSQGDWG